LWLRFSDIVGEEYVPWVLVAGGEQEHALTALRKPERPGVHDAVRPLVAEALDGADDDLQRLPSRELEHERDVLKEDERDTLLFQQAEDLAHEPGPRTVDAGRLPGLA
jgi:hypothetical protein